MSRRATDPSARHDAEFLARQRDHFARADVDHFRWQTEAPGFAEREARFLAEAVGRPGAPLLEIGAGEGGNLYHLLGRDPGAAAPIGIDAFVDKLRFAARAVRRARFVGADAARLPFRDARFATVLVRDVLHHLPDPRAAVEEAFRVLAPEGELIVIEPNARNPLIRLQMALVPAERGAARSDPDWLVGLLGGLALDDLRLAMAAPLPLDRVLLHHRFGAPSLGARRSVLRLLDAADAAAVRWLPQSRWSYVIARGRRRG